jgi:hypothetical protein
MDVQPKKPTRKQVTSKPQKEATVPSEEHPVKSVVGEEEEESVEAVPIHWYTATELEEIHHRIFDWLAKNQVIFKTNYCSVA